MIVERGEVEPFAVKTVTIGCDISWARVRSGFWHRTNGQKKGLHISEAFDIIRMLRGEKVRQAKCIPSRRKGNSGGWCVKVPV